MAKDLTNSVIDRQNILNNDMAIEEIKKNISVPGIMVDDKIYFTVEYVASFYEVDPRTIRRYIENNSKEFNENGYEVLIGQKLKDFLKKIENSGKDINVLTKEKITRLSVFDFRAFLNIGMLLSESERAKEVRKLILDIVIDLINKKTGGGTKYINQRDEDYLESWYCEENYRKLFTDALCDYVVEGKYKYARYTDKIYESIFKENTKEYKAILNLNTKDKVRDTFYSEVLDLISSYEGGFSEILKSEYLKKNARLEYYEVDKLFDDFSEQKLYEPLKNKARNKMASRDLAFRDALHLRLTEYISPLDKSEFERFLGLKSQELLERMKETEEVFKRLKDRE